MPIFGGIFIGRRHGAFDSTPSGGRVDDSVGPSFPPAGSYNSTLYGETYPVEQGGTDFENPVTSESVPNQIVDVNVLNDGEGGTYIDWSSANNLQFQIYGVPFYTEFSQSINIEVPSGSGNYYQGGTHDNQFIHDGSGGWTAQGINQSYYSNGSDTNIEYVGTDQTTEVPSSSGNYYSNGRLDGYTWDGSGGYNAAIKGGYYAAGSDTNISSLVGTDHTTEVPNASGNYYSNGLFDGYIWDGSGGYDYPVTKGNYYSSGVQIDVIPTGNTQSSVEVPSGSGNYYDSEQELNVYVWDGGGGYSSYFTWQLFPSGTFITNDGSFDYYWDGNGGYYS